MLGFHRHEAGSDPKPGPSTFIPAPAMWAVAAPAAGNAGNSFWMLPLSGGGTSGTPTSACVAQPEQHHLWQYKASGGGFEFPGGGGARFSPVQLSPVQPVQQLGLGVSETNLGMLPSPAINAAAYTTKRVDLGMTLEQHQHHGRHHNNQNHQPQGSDSGVRTAGKEQFELEIERFRISAPVRKPVLVSAPMRTGFRTGAETEFPHWNSGGNFSTGIPTAQFWFPTRTVKTYLASFNEDPPDS
nr:transcription factor TCP23-like [Ipomoea batatas]